MKLDQIDYTPLQGMDTAWDKVMRDIFKLPPAVTIGIAIGIGAIAFYFLQSLAFLYVLGIPIPFIAARVQTRRNIVWKDFALANGWYVTPIMGSNSGFLPPSIAFRGRGKKFSLVVHGNVDGHECDIFMYQFTTGGGKSKQTHYYTVVRVLLERPFPHLLIDSKRTWAIYDQGSAVQSVNLEGDFNNYFSLYVGRDEQIDALSIIAPDVMRTLIDHNQAHDIELMDQYLYFMAHADHRGAESLPALLTSVDALADQLAHKAKTIQYTPPGSVALGNHLAAVVAEHYKSGDRVMGALAQAILLPLFVVLGLILLIGLFTTLITLN